MRHEAWLRGEGTLTLHTDPPGAIARLLRFEPSPRRLVAVPAAELGPTPIVARALPVGSYVVELEAPGGPVRVPVVVGRLEASGPTDRRGQPLTLRLPGPSELAPDEALVPAGAFWSGGDDAAVGGGPRRRRWCAGFAMRRHPVTNAEYIAFLDHLVATGRGREALRHAPRERGGTLGEVGAVIYGQNDDGRFKLRADADGDMWRDGWPVVMVDWHAAVAFAAWESARTGQRWRLPTADEVEKAARGVDGRFYPWGDAFDPSWCCMRDSHPGRPKPADVDAFPHDRSPYGVRGLAGNVRCWCADGPGPMRRYDRGGSWLGNARECRAADVHDHEETHRAAEIGIRLVRDHQPAPR